MLQHGRKTRKNEQNTDGIQARKPKDTHPSYDQLTEENINTSHIIDTPFRPRIYNHAEFISEARSEEQRASIVTQLQRTYGNAYVQRLIQSGVVKAPPIVRQSDDHYKRQDGNISEAAIFQAQRRLAGEEDKSVLKNGDVEPNEQIRVKRQLIGDSLGQFKKAGKVLQRATVTVTEHPKEDAAGWFGVATGGVAIGDVFGFTNAYSLEREGEEVRVELWQCSGLPEAWNDVDDVETTADNWQKKINGLASMGDPAKPKWYSKEAVKAHEGVHASSDETVADRVEDELKRRMNDGDRQEGGTHSGAIFHLRNMFQQQGRSDHNSGATDAAEADKVVEKIGQIWRTAVENQLVGPNIKDKKKKLPSPYRTIFGIPQVGFPGNILTKIFGKKTVKTVKLKPDGSMSVG